jgi:protein-tyrosine phosphatase
MPLTLFICSGNYYRSRFAEAIFNNHAQKLGRDDRAISRGLATHLVKDFPESLSPDTLAALRERNIALTNTAPFPRQLTNADLALASRIIALNAGDHRPMLEKLHPGWAHRIEFWDIHDVEAASPASQLPLIESRVLKLFQDKENPLF